MPILLAQAATPVASGWGALAPELVVTGVALTLLLLSAARTRPLVVMAPVGVASVGAGYLLLSTGTVVEGAALVLLGLVAPALVVVLPGRPDLVRTWASGAGLVVALLLTGWAHLLARGADGTTIVPTVALGGAFAVDGITLVTRLTVYTSALIVLALGHGYLRDRALARVDLEPVLLLSVVGMAVLGGANDLITVFIALELLSIALYVLAGWARRDRRSQEAALKYLVLGAVASAVLLYGMALTYLATGSLDLPAIGQAIGSVLVPRGVVGLAIAFTVVGLGFKVALVPFHLWTPDVYQGAPTNVTAFMAAATKAAGFAAALRLLVVAFGPFGAAWAPVLAVLAAVSMLYGAWGALVQQDVKRILAYSSITHAGYAAIAIVARSDAGVSALLWYLLTYAVATLGAFGAVIAVERRRRGEVTLLDLRGLGRTSPMLAGLLALSLLSLAGIPATAGFLGKLTVFQAGIAAGWTWLVVVGVVSSVIAAGFYLRIVGVLFLEEADPARGVPVLTGGLAAGLSVAGFLVLFLGLQPQLLLELAGAAASIWR
ncbi:MAG: NADH-quinone oxidoreductase subunit N [Gaiellales bacterium]